MKILYDHQIFQAGRFSGISRYFFEIMERLESHDSTTALAIKFSINEYLRQSKFKSSIRHSNLMQGTLGRIQSKLHREINKRQAIKTLNQQDFDLFHPTYFENYFLPHLGSKPFVLTVYDMITEIYPECFRLSDMITAKKRNLAEKADRIIAISESTKNDLTHFFDIPSEKIQVIHLANSLAPPQNNTDFERGRISAMLPERYLLFVGSRVAYKNFYFFLNSVTTILKKDPTLYIVCTGLAFTADEESFFNQLGLAGRIRHLPVNDSDLANLYQRALAFIFPSLYEGFGLPVLEAFSCGCPALLSNTSSLPEIGADAALYFEPKNALSIQGAIADVLYKKGVREDLVHRGSLRAKAFSWEQTANATNTLYKTICDRNLKK